MTNTKSVFSASRRTVLASGASVASLAALAAAGLAPRRLSAAEPARKSVVVYFSRTGSTERLAKTAAATLGCEIIRIDVQEPYAEAYSDMTYVAREEKRAGKRRELKSVPNLSDYDVVYLGSPFWWGGISVPVATLLMDRPLAGKTVKPFVVSGSSDPSGAWADIRRLCPDARVLEGFHTTTSRVEDSLEGFKAWATKV